MLEPTPPLADASVDAAASVPEPASTPQPFPGFWQSLGLILLVMACSAPAYAVGKAISALLQALGVPLGARFDLVGKPIIRALPYVVVLWLGARWAGTTLRETYPLRPVRLVWLPMFVVAQAGISAIVAAAASVLEQVLPAPSFLEKLIVHAGPFAVIFLAPLTEEPLHRGLMLGGMLKRYSRPRAVVLSALVFGIAHLNPWQFVSAFLLGLFLGWVVAETGSLWLPILGHGLHNATFFLLHDKVPEPPKTVVASLLLVALGLPLLGAGVMMLRRSFRERTV